MNLQTAIAATNPLPYHRAKAETPAMQVVRAWFADITPAEAITVLGWIVDTAISDPDPIGDHGVGGALNPVREAYLDALRGIERELGI